MKRTVHLCSSIVACAACSVQRREPPPSGRLAPQGAAAFAPAAAAANASSIRRCGPIGISFYFAAGAQAAAPDRSSGLTMRRSPDGRGRSPGWRGNRSLRSTSSVGRAASAARQRAMEDQVAFSPDGTIIAFVGTAR
jgi:hypothetical protein